MQTEVKIGSFTFGFDQESGLVFIDNSQDSDALHCTEEEWQNFVETSNKLCKCGGSCGC